MTMVRGAYAQLMAPGAHAAFVHWLNTKQRASEYEMVFNIDTSDKAYEDEWEFSGIGPLPEKPEGEALTYQDAVQGGTKRYQHYTYGLGVRASFELFDDDQYGIIKQVPKALARSAQFTIEQNAWNVFNLGFTSQVTSDGVSLFNNQHPLLGGTAATNIGPGLGNVISAPGTYPNRPATDVDLSITALQLAIQQFERMPDSQGMPIQVKPSLLIIPPELKFIAREILGSPHKPYTSDNEINSILNEDLKYFVGHYLTGVSPWYLTAAKDETWLKFFWRQRLDEDFADDFDTRSVKQVSFMRFSVGATSWIGVWGSNGP
jgi:Mu-like prophage major head subunit gpT